MPKAPLLKVRNLHVHFPIFGGIFQRRVTEVKAVDGISFDVYPGETLGIVGESGCGKSTVGKALINVLRLTAPDVEISGEVFLEDNGEYIDLLSLSRKEMNKHRPDMQMIFMFSVLGSARKFLQTCNPLIPGKVISKIIIVG